MAMEISLDLINQLKVSLRKEAELSSFDPGGDYFSSLPTAAEAIAELDACAPYLRCRNCKGKLLRGIDSLICVFCGNQQRTSDNPPDPIKFTSTAGYKCFLSSLNLDGWEMVEPLKEKSKPGGGASAPVVEPIPMSKFLDLEIQWSAIEEKHDEQSMQNRNPLNLGGISLDEFFVERKGDDSNLEPKESRIVDDDFKDPRSLSLFDDVKTQELVEPKQRENAGLFEVKDAQKSASSAEHENLSLFAGQDAQNSVSLADQGKFGFFEERDAEQRISFKEDENLSFFEAKDENVGLFEAASSSNTEIKSLDDKIVGSSSDWDSDFQFPDHNNNQEQINSHQIVNSTVDLTAHMDSVFGSGKDLHTDSSTVSVSKTGDWFQDNLFSNVTDEVQNNESAVPDKNEVVSNGNSSMDIDWIGDDPWQASGNKPIKKTAAEDNDDSDWNDFASSANSKTPSNLLSQNVESSQGEFFDGLAHGKQQSDDKFAPNVSWTGDEKQNTATSVMSDIGKGQEDDLFGAWDSFTSVSVQPPSHVNPSAEQNSEIDLFGTQKDHQDLVLENISPSNFLSESIGGQTNSMASETSALERTTDLKSKSEVADELISQMHDLSFMLDTKLSVPPNPMPE